jgi:hypothetical protein
MIVLSNCDLCNCFKHFRRPARKPVFDQWSLAAFGKSLESTSLAHTQLSLPLSDSLPASVQHHTLREMNENLSMYKCNFLPSSGSHRSSLARHMGLSVIRTFTACAVVKKVCRYLDKYNPFHFMSA